MNEFEEKLLVALGDISVQLKNIEVDLDAIYRSLG